MIFPLYMIRENHVHGFDTSVEVFPVGEELAALFPVFRLSVASYFHVPKGNRRNEMLLEVQLILCDTQAVCYPSMSFIDGYSSEQRQQ